MKIELKKLGEIITGNTPSKKDDSYWDSADICFVKPDGIADEGITLINDSSEHISENARNKARVVTQDAVFVTCIGSIGKIGVADSGEYAFNQQINVIEPNERVLPRYLAYNLLYSKPRLVAIANASVVPIINKTQFGDFVVNIDEDKTEQAEIVAVLDKLTGIIEAHKKEHESLDELIKARFVELFGDPVLNEKGWKTRPFLDMGSCKNGMNFHYEDSGVELNCLGVWDFKDYSVITNTELLPTVSLNEMRSEEYLLRDDDITIPYLLRVLKTDSIRKKMAGRDANIQNLNQQILGTLIIPLPPLDLQNQFAKFVEQM